MLGLDRSIDEMIEKNQQRRKKITKLETKNIDTSDHPFYCCVLCVVVAFFNDQSFL